MNSAKKYLKLPRTLGVCAAGIFVFVGLIGCKAASDEDVYGAIQQDANGSFYVQHEDEVIVNSYIEDAYDKNMISFTENEAENDYLQVKDEQAVKEETKTCSGQNQQVRNCRTAKAASKKTKVATKPNSKINIETPARCEITGRDSSIVSSIPMGGDSFKLTRLDNSDTLPRFEVNNYTFKKKPLDVAIQNLVKEADIKVFSDDALFPEVSGEKVRGELSAVIKGLAAAGDTFYRYDANKKQLFLSRWAPFVVKVPGGRVGMYTILDALRGANITNVQPNFGSNEIYMRLNFEKRKTIEGLIKTIEQSPNLLLFDVQVYRVDSSQNPLDWQLVVEDYGITRVNSSVNGIMGRILSLAPQKVRQSLVETLRRYASVDLISEGVVIMPNGWKVRFDIGQCAKFKSPEQKLSMLFQSNILSADRAESNIALDTPFGEITSFHTIYDMNDTLNIIAVKGSALNPEWDDSIQYIITLKPKLVRLVK